MFEMSYSEVPMRVFEIPKMKKAIEELEPEYTPDWIEIFGKGFFKSIGEVYEALKEEDEKRAIKIASKEDVANIEGGSDTIDHYRKAWKYGYQVAELNGIEQVARVIKSDHRCYSAGVFENGEAKNEKWLYQDLIIFDIDEGLSFEEAKELFGLYECVIATTRSHQKEKNGKVCDRFRVIIRAKERIECGVDEYRDAMRHIFKEYPFVDEACKDPSRIYFGFAGSKIWISDGVKRFDFYSYAEKLQRIKELRSWSEQRKSEYQRDVDYRFLQDGTRKDWYLRNWKSDRMKEKLRYHERFYAGNRNNYLYTIAAFLKNDLGFDDERVKEAIRWLDGGELGERELQGTIFKSLRLGNE